MIRRSVLVAFVGSAVIGGTLALGQTFDLSWHTIDGGGVMSSADGLPNGFELSGTIGQPDAQSPPVMSHGGFEVTGGFWPVADVCYCLSDMNGDNERDGRDVQQFVGCLLANGDCSCSDVDQIGGVTPADISVFVADLLAGDSCP